jgi:hypothetical protein
MTHFTRAAVEEGIVAGGAFLLSQKKLKLDNADEATGIK